MSNIDWVDPGPRDAFRKMVGEDFSDVGTFELIIACIFSFDLFFWIVNGLYDLGASFFLATVPSGSATTKLIAYVLLIPAFLAVKFGWYVVFYWDDVKQGACPRNAPFDIDWFSFGLLLVGIPYALEYLGAWVGFVAMIALFALLLPVFFPEQRIELTYMGIFLGLLIYGSVVHGQIVPLQDLLPEFLKYKAPTETVDYLYDVTTSFLIGPLVVSVMALFLVALSRIPIFSEMFQDDSYRVTTISTITGVMYFLLIVFVIEGKFHLLPT